MRSLALLGLVVLLLGVTAVISPWVAGSDLVAAFVELVGSHLKFTRVYNRVFEVLLVVGLVLTWRRLDLGGARAIGLHASGWWRHLVRGISIGSIGLVAGLAACWLGGGLVFDLRYDDVAKTVRKTLQGLGAAVAVGAGEEALFRGVLLRRVAADFGRTAGVVLTTAIYAVVHVLRAGADIENGPNAGIERTVLLFAPVADPEVWSTIAGLAGLGLLLAWARIRSGSLWLAIGIHAAWVAVFRVGRVFFRVKARPEWLVGTAWPPLIGGAAGAVALVATGLLLRRALARRR